MIDHANCKYEERWSELLQSTGRIEGKIDSLGSQVNGTVVAMKEHIQESDTFRNQVITNKVWVVIYRWIFGFLVTGNISLWVYIMRSKL